MEDWEFEYDDLVGKLFWISRENCQTFDTTQDLDFHKTQYAKHIEKVCNECGWKGTVYHR